MSWLSFFRRKKESQLVSRKKRGRYNVDIDFSDPKVRRRLLLFADAIEAGLSDEEILDLLARDANARALDPDNALYSRTY